MVQEIKKSQDAIVAKVNAIPNERKSVARVVEKKVIAGNEDVNKAKENVKGTLEKFMADPDVTMPEIHKYKNYGILPKKYAVEK